jgi:hypothetical protein
MRKMSKQMEARKWAELEKLVDARDAIEMEVMKAVFERLPYGQKFTLSDGSVGHLRKLAEPELCSNQSSDHYQRPHFGFDVVIEGGTLDHVEIYAFQTGSGKAIGPAAAEQNASANSQKPDEAATAQTPGSAINWTASHGRRTGRPSGSSPSR